MNIERKITVGWCWHSPIPDILVHDPERYKFPEVTNFNYNKKGLTECPAHRHYFNNLYVLRSPLNFNLRAREGWSGPLEEENDINPSLYNQAFTFHKQEEMYNLENPIIQFNLGYLFVSDEDCSIELIPPFMHNNNWPGQMTPGSFNIHKWIRPISWGFVWNNIEDTLSIKEGDPLCYVKFNRNVDLKEIELTDDIKNRTYNTGNITSWTKGAFKYMNRSLLRRPKRLINIKKR